MAVLFTEGWQFKRKFTLNDKKFSFKQAINPYGMRRSKEEKFRFPAFIFVLTLPTINGK